MRIQPNDEHGDRPTSTSAETDGTASFAARGPGSKLRLRNWRVRWRLIALILIPTTVAVAFGGLRISTSADRSDSYGKVEKLAELGSDITALVHELATERDLSAAYIAAGRGSARLDQVKKQYPKVDAAASQVRTLATEIDASYGAQAQANAVRVRNRLDGLVNLRTNVSNTKMPALSVIIVYSQSIDDLLAFNDVITQGVADERLSASARATQAVSRAESQASEQRGLLYADLLSGVFTTIDQSLIASEQSRQDSELALFREAATVDQAQLYDNTVIGPEVDAAEVFAERAIAQAARPTGRFDLAPGTTHDADQWLKDSTARIDLMRGVERTLGLQIIASSKTSKDAATRSALLGAGAIAAVLFIVLLVTLVMAQSLVGPLRRLRLGALDIAGTRLPDLVRRLRDPEAGNENLFVEPIAVDTTDEIGEVARSFDEVHREAVRLASNEALLRGNVNAMFVNLSRRSQSLIERQLRLIEDLEQSEQDSGSLDNLFKLDHLATRMRRNCENLLVLGGQEQARRWNEPVSLVDIVRASLSEVEKYERVSMRIQDEVSVVGRYVNDLVHLAAELVENATSFSPEHTKVAISGHLLSGGGAMLQISDNGVGMSPEELEGANWRLANPPTIDVSVSRRMGLFVVGRLAQRHGIRVELRAALSGGLTAFVILPANAIVQDQNAPAPPPPELSQAYEAPPKRPVELSRVPETPREPVRSGPLPKRRTPATSPPGRGTAPTAPARSAPSAAPMRSPSPPQPAAKSPRAPSAPTRPPAAGSVLSDNRSRDQKSGQSPIFEAMQSEWFQRRKMDGPMSRSEPHPEWSSPGDEGWRAAESVREPAVGGQTSAGLPKRVPGTNRIPGSAGSAVAAEPRTQQRAPARSQAPPEAEAVRNRFASFQQGVRRGRAAIRPDDEREIQ